MFDIGFFELLLIGIVGLVVIGPKRLPETIRFVGLWVGRIKRSLGAAKREFEQEFGVDEVRRQLHNEDMMKQFGESKDAIQKMSQSISSLEQTSTESHQDKNGTSSSEQKPSDSSSGGKHDA